MLNFTNDNTVASVLVAAAGLKDAKEALADAGYTTVVFTSDDKSTCLLLVFGTPTLAKVHRELTTLLNTAPKEVIQNAK